MYDTIIIGAGMSGLAAGIRLAYYDQRVCILERHSTIGGLNSFYRLNGRNYDVGLHAVTNYAPRGARSGPLARLLRQLRIGWEELALCPQSESSIVFPGVTLRFNNDPEYLCSQVRQAFPGQADRFLRLLGRIADYGEIHAAEFETSAREVVAGILTDPLLLEMLFCPLMYYGSARERDMDFGQFCILFRSIFLEGLARPFAGVRRILKSLVRRFKAFGGDLRLRSGVRRIAVRGDRASHVELDDGTELAAKNVLSSAGVCETLRLCDGSAPGGEAPRGQLSFMEGISVLDRPPKHLGHHQTIVFFNDSPRFHWEKPNDLADLRSGTICSPNNFVYDQPLPEGIMRVTMLANYDRWSALSEQDYRLAKLRWYDRMLASAVRFVPDFRGCIVDSDVFTPKTVQRYTGHFNGAVYGSPRKQLSGRTHLANLFICGTDQGNVGIIGAIISGISVANRYLLRPPGA